MKYHFSMYNLDQNQKLCRLSYLLAFAIATNLFELILPRIPLFPWMKIGLANIFTLVVVVLYSPLEAVRFAILRTILTGFLSGMPVTSFLFSGAAGIASALTMSFFWQVLGKKGWLGLLGIGVLGATIHNLTQLFIASFLFIQNNIFLWQIPFVILFSLVSGGIIGVLSMPVIKAFEEVPFNFSPPGVSQKFFSIKDFFALILFLASVIGIFFVNQWEIFLVLFLLLLIVSIQQKVSIARIFKPVIKFWGLFVWNFALNLLFTSGRYWFWIITYEGVEKSVLLSLRLIFCIVVSALYVERLGMDYPLYLFSKIVGGKNTLSMVSGALQALPQIGGQGKRMKWRDLRGFKDFLEKTIGRAEKKAF